MFRRGEGVREQGKLSAVGWEKGKRRGKEKTKRGVHLRTEGREGSR